MYISPKYCHQLGHTLVFQVGELNTRVGYAGNQRPDAIIPSATIGTQSNKETLEWWAPIPKHQGQVVPVVQNGQLSDWQGLQLLMQFSVKDKLLTSSEQSSVLMVQNVVMTKQSRGKLIQLLFETMNFKSAFVQKSPVLASYMCAKENVMIVDVGAFSTQVVPIVQGFISNRGLVRHQFGGQTLTQQLLTYIQSKVTISSRYNKMHRTCPSFENFSKVEFVRQIKETVCQILDVRLNQLKFNEVTDRSAFELPDKSRLDIGIEMFSIPQKMFQQTSDFKGIPKLIQSSLQKLDMQIRRQMVSNINIIGGGSCFPFFTQRLQRELQDLDLYGFYSRLKIYSAESEEKKNASWIGGSIMGCMPQNDKYVLTKKDFEEFGVSRLQRMLI